MVELNVPEGITGLASGAMQFEISARGTVTVPQELADHLIDSGWTVHYPSEKPAKHPAKKG